MDYQPSPGFFKRRRWVTNCAFVAVVAFLEAKGIAAYTSERLTRVVLLAAGCASHVLRAIHAEPTALGDPVVPAPAPVDPPTVSADELRKAIQRVGPTRFRVDHLVFWDLLCSVNNPGPPTAGVYLLPDRIVPDVGRGKLAGVRLLGVRRGSPFDFLGLENGDRVEAVNGIPVDAPQPSSFYAELRTATHLTVAIHRRGQSVRLEYELK